MVVISEHKHKSVSLTKPNITTTNCQSVHFSLGIMHLSMDWTLRSLAISTFFGTAKIAPASAAFSRGPSHDEFSSEKKLHLAEDLVSSFPVQSSTVFMDIR